MDGCAATAGLRLVRPTVMDLAYLARNMREDEIAQYLAYTDADSYDPDTCARGLARIPGVAFALIEADNLPVCAAGLNEVRQGVWNAWMVGTQEGWDRHWRSITKHTRRVMDQMMQAPHARRIEIMALASRTRAHAWYQRGLAMQYEGTKRSYGRNREDFMIFARLKER